MTRDEAIAALVEKADLGDGQVYFVADALRYLLDEGDLVLSTELEPVGVLERNLGRWVFVEGEMAAVDNDRPVYVKRRGW